MRHSADLLDQESTVNGRDQRDVGNRIRLQARTTGAKHNVAWSSGTAQIACKRNNYHRCDTTRVQAIALDNHDRARKTGA